MTKVPPSLDTYVASSRKSVQGFLKSLDAHVIHTLLQYQAENGIAGHLCEIGVHHGQLFLMLALARRGEERALAIDLFEDDPMNAKTRHAGRDRALFENARRLGIELSDQESLKSSSLVLSAADILARTAGPIRFFSVDGGHLYHHVENDLRLAEQTLSPDGIVAVDDFFNIGWADVSFATYDFLRKTESLVPFLVTPVKLYLAPRAVAPKYKDAIAARPDLGVRETVPMLGNEVLALRQGVLKRGCEFLWSAVARHAS